MKFIFTSYTSSPEFSQPEAWLNRIEAYTCILERLSRDHTVIGIERINYEGRYEQNGVQYYFIKQKRKKLYFPGRIHRLIKELQPDAVFINGLIFPLQLIQLRLKLGPSVKIISIHRSEKPFTGLKKYLQRIADKCVDAYFFSSSGFNDEWRNNINVKKIQEVITLSSRFYFMDRSDAVKITRVKGNLVFLWVGSLIPRKDPLTVVRAFLEFVRNQPEARLYMIYHEDQLLPQINELLENEQQYRNTVILKGRIPHAQLLYWYNSTDFFILGSHFEGTGVALPEAMSCGCIPIVTDINSFRRMTYPGKCGLLYQPGNEKELQAALLMTPELHIENERAKVLQQFEKELSFEAVSKKIEQVISTL